MEHEYSFLMDFISYFQMLTLLDLGMIFINRNSAVVVLQKRIINEIKLSAKEVLNHAGEITKTCRIDSYSNTTQGRKILGMANMIRSEKEAFLEMTETERNSTFMPAMGFTSGLFCLLYVLMVPFYSKTGNFFFIHILEYFAEAVYVSHAFVLLSVAYKGAYRGFLSSLSISLVWLIIPLVVILTFHWLNCTITCCNIIVYLIAFIILALAPILTMFVRIVIMIIYRYNRINDIKKKTKELSAMLNDYKARQSS